MLVCVYRTLSSYKLTQGAGSISTFFNLGSNNISMLVLYSISRRLYLLGDTRQMILDLLIWIRLNYDRTLSFRSSCCEGVCGSCAMLINNTNTLACIQPIWLINSYVLVYPLPHFHIIRDLVVDLKHFYEQYTYISPFFSLLDSSGFADSITNIVRGYQLFRTRAEYMDIFSILSLHRKYNYAFSSYGTRYLCTKVALVELAGYNVINVHLIGVYLNGALVRYIT